MLYNLKYTKGFSYVTLQYLKKIFLEREGRKREKNILCGFLLSALYWGPGQQPRHVS